MSLARVVFLFDVDNTLLDNDRFTADLGAHLDEAFGHIERQRYWAIYEELRDRLGYADYLGALQLFRHGLDSDPGLLRMSRFLIQYPFVERLYPSVLETIAHLRPMGLPVILSDGDVVFQPHKIEHSGLWTAFNGEVLIYVHKQRALASVQQRYPAEHYVMIDDKPNILAEMKKIVGSRLTTVFVRQGHYAAAAPADISPPPDLSITRIAELRERKVEDFLPTPSA